MVSHDFFAQHTCTVAEFLLGKELVCRNTAGQEKRGVIIETEAYRGWHDKASHASRGKTPRNAPMFGPPGMLYVYLVYGMHHCCNIVTEQEGYPAAVLIRGIRVEKRASAHTIDGPGNVSAYCGITRDISGTMLGKNVKIEEGRRTPQKDIIKTPRVGIASAGPSRHWRWRYRIV